MTHADPLLICAGVLATACAYWIAVAAYTALPMAFAGRKIQAGGNRPLPHGKLVALTVFNQTVVAAIAVWLLAWGWFALGGGEIPLGFPAWWVVLLHFAAYAVAFDVLFYFGHRLLHTRFMFLCFHSLHHRFKAPVPYSGACVHPVEFLLCYVIPNLTAAMVFGFSYGEYLLFISLEYVHNVHDHCGWTFRFDPFLWLCTQNAPEHDAHHADATVNFSGAFTVVLDRIFGTYRKS